MKWRWTYVWLLNGKPITRERTVDLWFDGRHMADMEIRRNNQRLTRQGYELRVLSRDRIGQT